MKFRWLALIALWTLVSGPILGTPTGPGSTARKPGPTAVVKSPSSFAPADQRTSP